MNVNCLKSQETLFETRILNRMATPVFLLPDQLPEYQKFPLILFGQWYSTGFAQGIKWLSSIVFKLKFPCIILPPFDECNLSEILGLKVKLNMQNLNSNQLKTSDEEIGFHTGQKEFQIQSDTGFIGPGGKTMLHETAGEVPVMICLKPKNTATPLILCGVRLLSSSGLSNNKDRNAMFNGIIAWASTRQKATDDLQNKVIDKDKNYEISGETLNLISVIIAGTGVANSHEITAIASSIFGMEMTHEEISAGLDYLSQNGFIFMQKDQISVCKEAMEKYVQDIGLWSHVRILRKEFSAKQTGGNR
ncbi:Uncharacterized protein dnl_06380 [Desulfonema limicola]|uniref:Uncharacterized protein n=1 Tax=Desulfonema limicola TaxID=45656 RepID=A0A975GEN7_9BACT|nr:hypothetical protein [Desulfonema limicola]QTA78417.1 Uncharacterized protein dnl_06380 [Desulfonema limicola]